MSEFPIVGIGASAGGLDAFEQFFRGAASQCGMAFVLVQHLDPEHVSMLTEILQRVTELPVVEVTDQMPVERDHVYVIPPNRDMTIHEGILRLSLPEQPRGQRMAIDDFLISLAADQGRQAIGVILSGTGSDGTVGLQAICAAGGIALVQDPSDAKFDGMPNSAIRSGCAARIALPSEMLRLLAQGAPKVHAPVAPAYALAPVPTHPESILSILRTSTGHDFSQYKKSTIQRRIDRCMARHELTDQIAYARFLIEHPEEIQTLLKELLINVTSFFRDPLAFAVMKDEVLPLLIRDKPAGFIFRAWVVGCASGEEAYSLVILLREFMLDHGLDFRVQLYATDLDEDAIASARAGRYPASIAPDVGPDRLKRYFVREETGYRVTKEIRDMVIFALQNVIKDPPLIKLDLLCCRNLLIYLEPALQDRLILMFHYALKPGGILFLSPAESIGNHGDLFQSMNRKWKFYTAIHASSTARRINATQAVWTPNKTPGPQDDMTKIVHEPNYAELTRRTLLQYYAPASIVTDPLGAILFVHGDTGKYLRPAPGQATLNVIDMAREGLGAELRAAIQLASERGSPPVEREAQVKADGGYQRVRISVRRVPGAAEESFLLVSFLDLQQDTLQHKRGGKATGSDDPDKVAALERDLTYTRENLKATFDEHQAFNEELRSTNEELQSTNEELQSTNEELETSKEELQSVNEELVTVNNELQSKIEQLAGMQNDMKNLLDNMNIGTIFLDDNLVIRRFTREATKAYRLVASDVGRPLADIKSDLVGDDLLVRARAVLESLSPYEVELS
ncbi:MAG: chemotaxis protein CheB, partial [Burkholderiales bacterium]